MVYVSDNFFNPQKVFSIGKYFIYRLNANQYNLYRVRNVDVLQYVYTGTLSAGQLTTPIDLSNPLVPAEDDKVYGFTIGVRGPVKVMIFEPESLNRFGLGSFTGYITQEISPYEEPNLAFMIYTIKNTRLAMQVQNMLNTTVNYAVRFYGYRYLVELVAQVTPDGKFTKIAPHIPDNTIKLMIDKWFNGELNEISTSGLVALR